MPPARVTCMAQGWGCQRPWAASASLAPPHFHLGLAAAGGRDQELPEPLWSRSICTVFRQLVLLAPENRIMGTGGCSILPGPGTLQTWGQTWDHTLQPCLSSLCSPTGSRRMGCWGQGDKDREMGVWDPSLRACPTQGLSSLQQPHCWLRAEQKQVGRELNNKLAFSRGFHLFYFKFLPVSACRAHQRHTGRQHARHCLTAASLTRKPTRHEPLMHSHPPAPQPVPMVARGSVVLPEWVGITHQFGTSSPALPGSAQPRESLGHRTSRLLGLSWERGAAAWHPEQNHAPRAGLRQGLALQLQHTWT